MDLGVCSSGPLRGRSPSEYSLEGQSGCLEVSGVTTAWDREHSGREGTVGGGGGEAWQYQGNPGEGDGAKERERASEKEKAPGQPPRSSCPPSYHLGDVRGSRHPGKPLPSFTPSLPSKGMEAAQWLLQGASLLRLTGQRSHLALASPGSTKAPHFGFYL